MMILYLYNINIIFTYGWLWKINV